MSRRDYWLRRLWKLRLGVMGGLVVLGMCLMAILAPVIAPYDPLKQDLGARLFRRPGTRPARGLIRSAPTALGETR